MTTTSPRPADLDSGLGASAAEVMVAQLDAARDVLAAIAGGLVQVDSRELALVAASAAAVVASAHAAQAAIGLESPSRGVIADSDHPRVDRWVEHSFRDAGAAVPRALHEVSMTCAGPT